MKVAIADPPYPGCCSLYGHYHEEPYGCWDQIAATKMLIRNLDEQYEVVAQRMVMRDWIAEGITMQRGLTGAKPERVCMWEFEMLGMERDDELVDLFPGSGAITRAWEKWRGQFEFGVSLSSTTMGEQTS